MTRSNLDLQHKLDDLSHLLRERLRTELCLEDGAATLRSNVERLQGEKLEMISQISRMFAEEKWREQSNGELRQTTTEIMERQRHAIASLERTNAALKSEMEDLKETLAEVCAVALTPPCSVPIVEGSTSLSDVGTLQMTRLVSMFQHSERFARQLSEEADERLFMLASELRREVHQLKEPRHLSPPKGLCVGHEDFD
jgi:gas vesicle protein